MDFTVVNAGVWEQKTWDLTGLPATSRDAIRYLAFVALSNTPPYVFKFDKIEAVR
ncbi:MAG: hypothetical protein HY906_18540 [Deltaproteobacteria bacterium]|nr:hypothetical protein [Deltaproteobacteria bacterium]